MKHERSRDLSVKPKSLTKQSPETMLPLPVKSKSAERKAQKNIRFQVVTGLQPSAETSRSIPSTASQHVQPGVARGAWVDGGTRR